MDLKIIDWISFKDNMLSKSSIITWKKMTRVGCNVSRLGSNMINGIPIIVFSPEAYAMKELLPSFKHGPLATFVMQNFLKPSQKDQ